VLNTYRLSLSFSQRKKVKKSSWIVLFTIFGMSCLDQPDCFNLTNNSLTISFRKIADGALDTLFSAQLRIAGLDTVINSIDNKNTAVRLPVDFTATAMSLSLSDQLKERSIDIGYTVQPQFVSEECGPRFLLANLTASSPSGDSVRVVNATLGGSANLFVYRCPRTNIARLAFKEVTDEGTNRKDTVTIASTSLDFNTLNLYSTTGSLSFINVPLNLEADNTQVVFRFSDVRSDTIVFSYERVQETRYKICGPQTFIRKLKVVSPDLDRIELPTKIRYKADSIYDPPRVNFEIIQ
jgi:hypothetical protein